MKLLLKILTAPIIAVLTVAVWMLSFALNLASGVLGLVSLLLGILGGIIFFADNATNGIIVLITAFLISPYGLPMLAVLFIGKIQKLRCAIQHKVYG